MCEKIPPYLRRLLMVFPLTPPPPPPHRRQPSPRPSAMRSIRTAAALAAALASALGPARAFAPARPAFGRRPSVPSSSSSAAAAAAAEEDSSGDGQKPRMYPALSREEVEKFLQADPSVRRDGQLGRGRGGPDERGRRGIRQGQGCGVPVRD